VFIFWNFFLRAFKLTHFLLRNEVNVLTTHTVL